MMSTAEHSTAGLPLIQACGERGIIERLLLGSGETLDQYTRWHQRVTGPQIPGMVSTITLLFGTWLAITPLLWTHPDGAGWFASGWNEALTGTAVAVLGLTRLSRPSRLTTATSLGIGLGAWLVAAPFLFGYGNSEEAIPATVTDIMIGLILLAVTALGHYDARRTPQPDATAPIQDTIASADPRTPTLTTPPEPR
ncbi:SPW repeat domain-containing protein [Nocardia rhizosphaerihabitans]|uniref:SPW repeat-containing integral membrane domain-containing protein n=1 Tax=Nocardia rhizosphaerihabitans TaxID=1691570 RepID=A0ABQ2L1K0_9NOCA|nr:hypothetical protein [Nocardia rhizosphaerihabitans]GGN99445.1 hypothetical protein GCM10011610_67400 [Nocardia rhizosphaerihabitans]